MEILVLILIGFGVYLAIAAPIKRSKQTSSCPKCGTRCNASPWGTSIQHEYKFKCPKCKNVFYKKVWEL